MEALTPDDAVVATYREHGHALARGIDRRRRDGRDVRQGRGHQPRARRLDAPVRPPDPVLRRQRHRRRRAAARRRPGAGRPAAAPPAGDRLLLRRGRGRRGRVPRDHEPRRAVAPAGAVLLREQPLRHGHRAGAQRGGHRPGAAGRSATACRPGRSTAWTCSPSRTPLVGPRSRSAPVGAPSSWSCARTGSGPTRCTTPSATGPRTRSPPGASATRSTLLTERLRAGGLLTDDDVAAIERDVAAEIDAAVASAEAGTLEPVEDLTRFVTSERGAAGEDHLPRGDAGGAARRARPATSGCSSWARTSAATAAASPSAWACSRSSGPSGSATPLCRSRRSSAPASAPRSAACARSSRS